MAMRTQRGRRAPACGCPQVAAPKTPAPAGKAGLLWPRAACRKRQEQVLPGEEAASSASEAAASCLDVLVELSAPPTGSASAPRRSKVRGRDHRWCAGGNRCRHPSNGAGRIAAGRDGGSGGGHSSLDSAGRSQRCRRSVRGSGPTGARRAGGGGVAGAALAPWGRPGDVDSVAIAPTGIGFAIESKTRTFDARHLAHARHSAAWLYRHRRRWCRKGALPVLCVVRARGLEGVEEGVLVVSPDRLVSVLRAGAGTSPRPGFLAS